VIEELYGPRASDPRLEIIGSFENEISPLEDGSGTVSCVSIASKDPCCSSIHLRGGGGGSKLIRDRPKSHHDWWIS
jgi:hypothetical protein